MSNQIDKSTPADAVDVPSHIVAMLRKISSRGENLWRSMFIDLESLTSSFDELRKADAATTAEAEERSGAEFKSRMEELTTEIKRLENTSAKLQRDLEVLRLLLGRAEGFGSSVRDIIGEAVRIVQSEKNECDLGCKTAREVRDELVKVPWRANTICVLLFRIRASAESLSKRAGAAYKTISAQREMELFLGGTQASKANESPGQTAERSEAEATRSIRLRMGIGMHDMYQGACECGAWHDGEKTWAGNLLAGPHPDDIRPKEAR